MTTNSIKIRSIQFLGRDGWVQLRKVGGEGSRWDMPVAMECRSYSVTLDELLESRRARGEIIKRQSDEIERLKAVNERDRSQVAETFTAIMEAIRRREWLRLGRGSYEYDDDRWRDEFREAIDEVIEAASPLRRIASDWSDCPTDPKEIAAARRASPKATTPETTNEP
jgi:hypothetical protein